MYCLHLVISMNYALINTDGLVVNVTVWDGKTEWQPLEGLQAIPLEGNAGIGWSYINGQFVPPTPPEEVTP